MFPIFAGNSASTGYNLTRSLRTRASASAYLNRTPSVASNRQTWTWSGWVKRGTLTGDQAIFFAGTAGNNNTLRFNSDNTMYVFRYDGSITWGLNTTQVFRDPSAWYHVVVAYDSTQATSTNRVKLYINGTQVTAFSSATYPSLNLNSDVNNTVDHRIANNNASNNFDGYQREDVLVDGQALTPSSFGSTNTLTGVWQPARYTGTYGTNGFYLPFTDNSALTTSSNVGLGKDFSGNGNYWTTNNISITAGVTYDSMTDVPTLTSATAANFCTWNPLSKSTSHSTSDGNLTATSSSYGALCATIGASSGKWYWEMTYTNRTSTNSPVIGFGNELFNYTNPPFGYMGSDLNAGGINVINGNAALNGASTAYGSAIATNDVVMFAMDVTNRKFYIGKNGTWFNSGDPAAGTNSWPYSATIVGSTFFPAVNLYTDTIASTFGQRPFAYTPPTGFVAMNTFNLPDSTIVKGNTVMDATLYTGAGNVSTSITNAAGFKPDLVWTKARSTTYNHYVYDSVRGTGTGTMLETNLTDAEGSNSTNANLSSFNSNGWTIGTTSATNALNSTGNTFVAWQWQAGQGSTSSNTNGTITSTVSVNASAGFSVVTYTANGTTATIGHGLGVTPQFIVVKARSSAQRWTVFHVSTSNAYIYLNETFAAETSGAATRFGNNSAVVQPTSSVFTIGNSVDVNSSGNTYVAYCWTPIAGFSAFGSLTGNGSTDGSFVYTPFRPKFVIIKRTDAVGDWYTFDSVRDPYNATAQGLSSNASASETTYTGWGDLLSNGFKIRRTDAAWNASGGSYIYMAYAENPFRNSLAR